MHGHQQQDQQQGGPGFKEQVSFLIGLCQALAAPVEAVLRKPGTVGEKHFAANAAIGIVLMPVIIAIGGGPYDGHCAVGAMMVACVFFAAHAGERRKQERNGFYQHSRYTGDSRFPGKRAKGSTEPAVLFLLGVCSVPLSYSLAAYLVFASASLAICFDVARMEWEARLRAQRDAMVEQQEMMSGMPGRREE